MTEKSTKRSSGQQETAILDTNGGVTMAFDTACSIGRIDEHDGHNKPA